jgi:hypothetical protein
MYPHRIRLRGPWECEPLDDAPRRVTLPGRLGELGLAGVRGRVRFVRRFGYPGRIDAGEHVWLTCAGLTGRADARLNDEPVADNVTGPWERDVTALLEPRNCLDVVLDAAADDAGLWGEVALEIRRDAYLQDVTARRTADGAIDVAGRVAGATAEPLELYALADRRSVHYQMIRAGQAFRFTTPADPSVATIRVELVSVAAVWYAAEVAVGAVG